MSRRGPLSRWRRTLFSNVPWFSGAASEPTSCRKPGKDPVCQQVLSKSALRNPWHLKKSPLGHLPASEQLPFYVHHLGSVSQTSAGRSGTCLAGPADVLDIL